MKRVGITYMLLAITLFSAARTIAQDATSIVKKADEKMRGSTSQATILIKTIRPTWSREW